ncbi:MAG: tetratricopeptide repeat protein [Acidobacteriota bacterium]
MSLAASFRSAALISFSFVASAPAWAQVFSAGPYDASRNMGVSARALRDIEQAMFVRAPDHSERVPSGPATVSTDVLRHPLTSKARRRLEKAMHLAELGKHPSAIKELRETLVREPSSVPYAENMLGVEYIETRQFTEARNSFEEAVRLMPQESVNHSNLGYSLFVAGDLKSSEQEVRKAILLNPMNTRAKSLLDLLLHTRRSTDRRHLSSVAQSR